MPLNGLPLAAQVLEKHSDKTEPPPQVADVKLD